MLDKKLFELLVCPVCKNKILYHKPREELICRIDRLAFPIKEGIPVMLQEQARYLPLDEMDEYK
jgi:uncharacterized protein YbaR (Trm112 family)